MRFARPIYYSPQDVAEALNVTRRTVYNWIYQGRLPALKAGPKEWRVTPEHLDAFLKVEQLREALNQPLARATLEAADTLVKSQIEQRETEMEALRRQAEVTDRQRRAPARPPAPVIQAQPAVTEPAPQVSRSLKPMDQSKKKRRR